MKIVTRNNPGENKIITLARVKLHAGTARPSRPRGVRDDPETATHRQQLSDFIARMKRIALTAKDEKRRIEAVQTLAALALLRCVTIDDMRKVAA